MARVLVINDSENWLYRWIDEYGIQTIGDYVKVSRKASALDRLYELSEAAATPTAEEMPRYSVVAGSRYDLSGELGCGDYECLAPQIDRLFSRIWHYFDAVIIDDISADDISNPMGDYPYAVQQRVRLLLHLRQIGAQPYIRFVPKQRAFCADHFREHAAAGQLDVLFDTDVEAQVVDELRRHARISIDRRRYGWACSVKHPALEEVLGTASHDDPARPPSSEQIAREVFGRFCNALVSDVSISQSLDLPLLQFTEGPWLNRVRPSSGTNDQAVALSMRLPMLGGLPARELLKIREQNWPEFIKFRQALKSAIEKQQSLAGSAPPQEVADRVVEENIQPGLADIDRHLKIVKGSLTKKLAAATFITGTVSSMGAIPGVPLVVAAGITAVGVANIGAAVPQVFKYIDQKAKSRNSDWYFLWQARSRDKH